MTTTIDNFRVSCLDKMMHEYYVYFIALQAVTSFMDLMTSHQGH